MDKRKKYFWNGEPVKTLFGAFEVREDKTNPLRWSNFECSIYYQKKYQLGYITSGRAIIPSIMISPYIQGYFEPFVIANHHGIGAYKLKKGGHINIIDYRLSEGVFSYKSILSDKKIDLKEYTEHERLREAWVKRFHSNLYEGWRIIRNRDYVVRANMSKAAIAERVCINKYVIDFSEPILLPLISRICKRIFKDSKPITIGFLEGTVLSNLYTPLVEARVLELIDKGKEISNFILNDLKI